jgi:glycosyltransferase involved in cell wall biosynthesis
VICAEPAGEPVGRVGELPSDRVHALTFENEALPFPIPGMSDVMPYRSTRFSAMSPEEVDVYVAAWRRHIASVVDAFAPDVIHVHHLWLVGALVRDIAPDARIVSHCHGTGLRQMLLCPQLADRVRVGCARNDRFVALHAPHRDAIATELAVGLDRVDIVGAGYRADVFGRGAAIERDPTSIVFAGKYAAAKGLPWLLDAVERLSTVRPVTLHVAGAGAGDDADQLAARMAASPNVTVHGMLSQHDLADLLRRSSVFVLPSMYEGLPLVLVEALACGSRAVATDLPGVAELAAFLDGAALTRVKPPRRTDVDKPIAEDLPYFVLSLEAALTTALDAGPLEAPINLRPFTWDAVFERIENSWSAPSR